MEIKKRPKKEPKKIKGFAIDEDIYQRFKRGCVQLNLSMSGLVQEFIKRVTALIESGEGGEVCFGLEGKNWKQPQKIVYDGKEILEREGFRTYKKEGGEKK